MIGTIGIAQTAPVQKTDRNNKEELSKPQNQNVKKKEVTVIERTTSDTVKETPVDTPAETPAINQSKNKQQVEKSTTIKKAGVQTKSTKKVTTRKVPVHPKE